MSVNHYLPNYYVQIFMIVVIIVVKIYGTNTTATKSDDKLSSLCHSVNTSVLNNRPFFKTMYIAMKSYQGL